MKHHPRIVGALRPGAEKTRGGGGRGGGGAHHRAKDPMELPQRHVRGSSTTSEPPPLHDKEPHQPARPIQNPRT